MVRKAEVTDRIFIDEAEGFLLSHALFSPPRTWPPLPPDQPTQAERLQKGATKMDWDTQMAAEASTSAASGLEPAGLRSPTQAKRRTASTGMADWFEIEQPSAGGSNGADGNGTRHDGFDEAEDSQERCVICLMALRDRTVVGVCGHEFCFECIGVWANQSRRCPLCSADMAPFLLHDLDNPVPTKFYLPPLPTRKFPPLTLTLAPSAAGPSRRVMSNQMNDAPAGAEQEEVDELDKQVERRREIYRHSLFVKHIPANASTGFKPNPTPRQIADTPALVQRATAFLRRELRIWGMADVEYLVIYVLNLLKAIDMRSEPFIRLLKDILEPEYGSGVGMGVAHRHAPTRSNAHANPNTSIPYTNGTRQVQSRCAHHEPAQRHAQYQYPDAAEHLAHELYSWMRSPYKELWRWDAIAQYDPVPDPTTIAQNPSVTNKTAPGPIVQDKQISVESRRPRSPSLASYSDRSRSRSLSSSSYSSSRSYSRSPSPQSPRAARDPSQRDTFIPTVRGGEKRWDEPDVWIDPEWEREEAERREERDRQRAESEVRVKRRREEREARQDAKRARIRDRQEEQYSLHLQQQARRNGLPIPVAVPIRALHGHGASLPGLRAWGEREAVGVELLPDGPAVQLPRDRDRAYEDALAQREQHGALSEDAGLHIRGRSSFGQGAEGRKLTLAERLAKAKAVRAAAAADGDAGRQGIEVAILNETDRALSDIPVNLPANPADINVEDLLPSSPSSIEQGHLQDEATASSARLPGTLSASAQAFIPTTYLTSTTSTTTTTSPSTVLERIARARQRLRLRLKLESERACLRHNIAESRAQTLRAKLLEAKIARQAGETDVQLRRMDKLERDREVRRRLMVEKMMSAETEGERRARELKERLARAKKAGKGGGGRVRVQEVIEHEQGGSGEEMGVAYRYAQFTLPNPAEIAHLANPASHGEPYSEEPLLQHLVGSVDSLDAQHNPAHVSKAEAPALSTKMKEKSAEEKAKEEKRRAKILRNLLLERKRAKGVAPPGLANGNAVVAGDGVADTADFSLPERMDSLGHLSVVEGGAGSKDLMDGSAPLKSGLQAENGVMEQGEEVVGVEDEWDLEPDAVI